MGRMYLSSWEKTISTEASQRSSTDALDLFICDELRNSSIILLPMIKSDSSSTSIICKECRQVSLSSERHLAHYSEPRHINHYRFMAYKDPKRRQMWLKAWCKEVEKAEEQVSVLYYIDELEEFTDTYKVL